MVNFKPILWVIFVAMGIFSFVNAILAYIQISSFASDVTDIIDSWQAKPIVDIRISSASPGAGYSKISRSWPGTYDGCDCENPPANPTIAQQNNVTTSPTSACSAKQLLQSACFTRAGWAAQELNMGLPIWIKRDGTSALQRELAGTPCTAAQQECTGGTYVFCWDANLLCPITDIFIGASGQTATIGADAELTYDASDPAKASLYYKRGGTMTKAFTAAERPAGYGILPENQLGFTSLANTGLPITSLSFTEFVTCTFQGSCGYDNNYQAQLQNAAFTSGNNRGWTLKGDECSGCTEPKTDDIVSVSPKGYDRRFMLFDAYSERDSLINTASIPAVFYPPIGYNLYFSFRSEITWTDDGACPTRDVIYQNEDEIKQVVSAQLAMVIINAFNFVIITCVMGYFSCKGDFQEETAEQDRGKRYNQERIWCRAKWCFKVTVWGLIILCVVVALGLIVIFTSVNAGTADGASCTDALSDETFTILGGIIEGLSMKNYLVAGAQGIDTIMDVLVSFMC